jgi:glutathione S-transferase
MVQYKLVYFNARGRAELTRFIFAVAGQEYEDFRFEREDWPKYKENAPFGQSPYLEVHDGSNTFVIAQSIAIGNKDKIRSTSFKSLLLYNFACFLI